MPRPSLLPVHISDSAGLSRSRPPGSGFPISGAPCPLASSCVIRTDRRSQQFRQTRARFQDEDCLRRQTSLADQVPVLWPCGDRAIQWPVSTGFCRGQTAATAAYAIRDALEGRLSTKQPKSLVHGPRVRPSARIAAIGRYAISARLSGLREGSVQRLDTWVPCHGAATYIKNICRTIAAPLRSTFLR